MANIQTVKVLSHKNSQYPLLIINRASNFKISRESLDKELDNLSKTFLGLK
tara:strand:- start:2095 stop:2247 length:153 start_codon:yes stop_codon:yes gene_type:complete